MPLIQRPLVRFRGADWDQPGRMKLRGTAIRGNQLSNLMRGKQLEDYPKDRAWEMETRDYTRGAREFEKSMRPWKTEVEAVTGLKAIIPTLNWATYPQERARLIQMHPGAAKALPEPGRLVTESMDDGLLPEDGFNQWQQKASTTFDQLTKRIQAEASMASSLKGSPSLLAKLINEKNSLPEGHPLHKIYDQRIQKESTRSGEKIEIDPTTGQITITRGEMPGKAKPGKIPAEQINQLASLKSIYDSTKSLITRLSDPEFGDIAGPIQGRWEALKIKYINDGETQAVMNELESLITIAYALSGKQISEKEMRMLERAILPKLKQPKANLLSTLGFLSEWVLKRHNNQLDYLSKGGYKSDIKQLESDTPTKGKTTTIGRFQVEVE